MTLRHDVKTRVGDSWSSPIWAVVLPGGLGVDLTDGWEVAAQVRASRAATLALHTYTVDGGGISLGTATVQLSDESTVDTSTVELHHPDSAVFPICVALWDCQISHGTDTYTIVEGTFRVITEVTR